MFKKRNKKEKKPGFWEKYALKKLKASEGNKPSFNLHILTQDEILALKKIKKETYWKAAIAGALGVLVLYIPYHIWEEALFPKRDFWIPYYEDYITLEIEFMIYGFILVILEIWYLTYINILAVCNIASTCGSPDPSDPNYEASIKALVTVSLEKRSKQLKTIGINPYHGLSKWGVFVFQLLLRLKATASNLLFKMIVRKGLGRYALRLMVDLVGIPVYAFWNVWGSRKVINEARLRVMAPPLVMRFSKKMYGIYKDDEDFNKCLYDTLQQIAITKRAFHDNHFLLATTLLTEFDIPTVENLAYNKKYFEQIQALNQRTRDGIVHLLVFGMVMDGSLSPREKNLIEKLGEKGMMPYPESQIIQWKSDFFEGKGLEDFFNELK